MRGPARNGPPYISHRTDTVGVVAATGSRALSPIFQCADNLTSPHRLLKSNIVGHWKVLEDPVDLPVETCDTNDVKKLQAKQ